MRLLNDIWDRRAAQPEPYPWLSTAPGELTSEVHAARLAASFPLERYVRREADERTSAKSYRNLSRPLVDEHGVVVDDALPDEWLDLVADLTSETYRDAVAGLLGQQPARTLELRLVQHAHGDWLGPHTDRQDKLFSHILYFNHGWVEEWGGCLEILASDDASTVAGRVVPALGASALLAQSPCSWHQVTRVRGEAPASRRSLLIHGLR
jgi:hypothetical protein